MTCVTAGNNRPGLSSVDEAIRRRLHLLPFTQTFRGEGRDLQLKAALLQERDGILQWMVEGCLSWQAEGLNPPQAVHEATESYLDEQDTVARWLAELGLYRRAGDIEHYKEGMRLAGLPE